IWAYMQDVGSRNTASVFGWGNMWGNLGAAVISQVIPYVLKRWDTNHDWHEVFLVMASGFLVAAIASLGLNATEPVERE
ncbi:MAG: MFS transporter, partial [Planctomycetaceae bacterium]|nr:MFS transporter [Planctomycetaceae bacterium]